MSRYAVCLSERSLGNKGTAVAYRLHSWSLTERLSFSPVVACHRQCRGGRSCREKEPWG